MGAEVVMGLVFAFVCGGAIGSVGTLLAQFIFKRVDGAPPAPYGIDRASIEALRSDVDEIGRHVHNLDARLDFTERLLDGAVPLAPPPERLREMPREEEGSGGENA